MKKNISNSIFSINFQYAIPSKCISMKNRECKVREVIINNEYMTYPFSIEINKCNGNCNNISNPYSRVCIPNIINNVTLKNI